MSCFYNIDGGRSSFDPRISNWNIHSVLEGGGGEEKSAINFIIMLSHAHSQFFNENGSGDKGCSIADCLISFTLEEHLFCG